MESYQKFSFVWVQFCLPGIFEYPERLRILEVVDWKVFQWTLIIHYRMNKHKNQLEAYEFKLQWRNSSPVDLTEDSSPGNSDSCSVVSDSATPWTTVHGILQARILEWPVTFSRASS